MAKFDKSILEKILKNAESGEFGLDEFVPRSNDLINDSIIANNLQEKALGQLMLDQYKGKIPNQKTSLTELRDFAEGLREQFTPDVKSKIEVPMQLDKVTGLYSPSKDLIQIAAKQSKEDFASALAHEALHGRDYKANDYGDLYKLKPGIDTNVRLKELKGASDLITDKGKVLDVNKMKDIIKNTDIDDIKEAMMKGHHGLKRGATIAKANLPRLLKGLPLLGVGAAALMNPNDASAAVPLLNEAENVGESPEQEAQLLEEINKYKAENAYANSPARLDRLRKTLGR